MLIVHKKIELGSRVLCFKRKQKYLITLNSVYVIQ